MEELHTSLHHPLPHPRKLLRIQEVAVPRLCNSVRGIKASGNFLLCMKKKMLWRQTENKP